MAYNYEYPYTDASYNEDWLLSAMKEVQTELETMKKEFDSVEEVYDKAVAYTDGKISTVNSSIASLKTELNSAIVVNSKAITALEMKEAADVVALEEDIDTKYIRNSQRISQQWEDMKKYISSSILETCVYNLFTGQQVSLQSMFNYLARLHLTDAGTYAQVSGINTYDYYEAKGATYEEVTMSSATFFNS